MTLPFEVEPWNDLVGSAPTGIFVLDIQFRVKYWNAMMQEMSGISFRDVFDTCLLDIFPVIADTELTRIYEDDNLNDSIVELEYCDLFSGHHRPGKHRYYTMKIRQIRDGRQPVGCVAVLDDTTINFVSKKALEESERRLSTLMDNLPGMAYRTKNDEHWTLEYASRGSKKMVGYTHDELRGHPMRNFRKRIHEKDQEKISKKIKEAVAKKKRFELFYRHGTTRGEYKWVWEQGVGVFDDSGKLVALEGYVNDFTTQKITELELRRENERLKSISRDRYRLGDMVGKSPGMQKVYELILSAAATDTNVIIYGESGTGKELVARAIHELSRRKEKAFLPVNCGAISETLLEREFFGHTKGAFTGAGSEKRGYLEAANNGTLFLDELGEISLSLQIKLLRVLDEKGYTPVGSTTARRSNVRIVAATNRNLREEVEKKRMRQDFFYRIHILPIYLPKLSERKEDIPLLIDFFQDQFKKKGYDVHIPASVKDAFLNHDWPGNIRELKNAVLRYITLRRIDFLNPYSRTSDTETAALDLPGPDQTVRLKSLVADYEKQVILKMLEKNQWNRTRVAKRLGIDRKTLFTKIKQYQLGPK